MAIVHDASSLAAGTSVTDTGSNTFSTTSANFSPPANSWIYLGLYFDDAAGVAGLTIVNSGTALTWTQVKTNDDATETTFVYRAFNSGAQTNINITVSGTDTNGAFIPITIGAFFVDVWTGAATTQTGAAATATNTTTTISNPSVTTTASGSQVSSMCVSSSATANPTSSDTILVDASDQRSARVYKAANSGAPGAVSINYVITTGGGLKNNFIVYEILAPAGGAVAVPSQYFSNFIEM